MIEHKKNLQRGSDRCRSESMQRRACVNVLMLLTLMCQSISIAVANETPAAEVQTGQEEMVDEGVLTDRLEDERRSAFNPYVVSTHKQNFVFPISYTSNLNTQVYDEVSENVGEDVGQFLRSEEVKFQLSLKVQLNEKDLLVGDDALFLGFTLEAWWQLYSKDVSSPFRETNYQPEIFYFVPLSWSPFGITTSTVFGLEHQSNGQIQGFSRSWNRLYAGLLVEKGNYFGYIRPWYRLPEKSKDTPGSPKGDDNPDILDFMGHGELLLGLRGEQFEYSAKLRGNFSTGKGAAQLSTSFPMFGRFRGVIQYFNGYGDSLVDYNHFQQRLSIGILMSNLF